MKWFKDTLRSQLTPAPLIAVPEFDSPDLIVTSGERGEPTMAPTKNTHFYDTLLEAGLQVIACGHDHVNDFCALLPAQKSADTDVNEDMKGPWLCHSGGCGFSGFGSYRRKKFYRRMRV